MPIITIRGQMGANAPEIAKLVADRLEIDYVDRQIIASVAARLNYPEQEIEAKEMPPSTLAGRISEALKNSYPPLASSGGLNMPIYLPTWEIPLDNPSYLKGLESVIKELAAAKSIVIHGRGSQFILKGYPNAFHVFTVAPIEVRVRQVMEALKLNEKAARHEINRFESSRREFSKRYFKADLEDPIHYDLIINTEHLSVDDTASIIIHAVSLRDHSAGG